MKITKKIMSVVMIGALITSQIGCAGKVTKISEPIDQVRFDKDYKYTFNLKNGNQVAQVSGDQIQKNTNQLLIQTKSEQKKLMNQDINQINGVTELEGSQAWAGTKIGFFCGAVLGGLVGVSTIAGFERVSLITAGIGGGIGALIGLGIGAMTPKRSRIQITPIVEPTKTGRINTGANLGVAF